MPGQVDVPSVDVMLTDAAGNPQHNLDLRVHRAEPEGSCEQLHQRVLKE
jgi:hypothetical protein